MRLRMTTTLGHTDAALFGLGGAREGAVIDAPEAAAADLLGRGWAELAPAPAPAPAAAAPAPPPKKPAEARPAPAETPAKD